MKWSGDFVRAWLKPRPVAEMKELATCFYENVGIEPPSPEYTEIWYLGDGKHYLTNKPINETVSPSNTAEAEKRKKANKGKWGIEVDVSRYVWESLLFLI